MAVTYIIAESCIDIKDLSCVDVCPVDCIHEFGSALHECGFHDHLIEARGMRALETRAVGVVREAHDRHVGPGVGDLLCIDAGDIRDHEIGLMGAVGRHEAVRRASPFELAPKEEVDPNEQDRGHDCESSTTRGRR